MGSMLDAVFPTGTILSCPGCGEGLYKVTSRSTTADLVMDGGSILVPLNSTIPPREVMKNRFLLGEHGLQYHYGAYHNGIRDRIVFSTESHLFFIPVLRVDLLV